MKVRAAETPPPNEPNRARTRPPWHLAATLAGLLLCAWIPLAPALRSDFAQGFLDPGDSRLVAFVLERNTEWLLGADSSGRSLSDLGIFYPVRDSLFYSDTLLGQLPFWAALRLLARDPVVAYHLLLALLLSLNFLVAHRWLARRDDVTSAGAFFGALLFAIGSPRIAHLFHVQLVAQFPLLLYVETLATALAPGPLPSRSRQLVLGIGVGIWWSFLFYLSAYLAWFAAFTTALAVPLALFDAAARRALRRLLLERWLVPLSAATLAGALVLPAAARYFEVARSVGIRPAEEAKMQLISPSAWWYLGPDSLLYGRLPAAPAAARAPLESEMRLGIGIVTTALVLWGLWSGRRRPVVRWTALPVALLCLLFTRFGDVEVWSALRPLVPGAEAFRAMSRAGLLALVPAALGLAFAFSAPPVARRRWLLAALALVFIAEQWQWPHLYSHRRWLARVEPIVAALPDDCPSFYYSPRSRELPVVLSQLDAMWASLATGIPTINGYSGALPRDFWLYDHAIDGPDAERAVARNLVEWLEREGLAETCWLRGRRVTRVALGSEVVPLSILADDFESGELDRWRKVAPP